MRVPELSTRRILASLLAAAVVIALASSWGFLRTERRERLASFERSAQLELAALADALELGGGVGERAAAVATAWASAAPAVAVRLIAPDDRRLEMSTFEADAANGPAPRALVRDEKPLFDLAQSLRASLEQNRAEGSAREAEIALAWLDGARLRVSMPLERDGAFVGMVESERAYSAVEPPRAFGTLLWSLFHVLLFVGPVAVVLGSLALWKRRSGWRWLLFLVGAVALAAGAIEARRAGIERLDAERMRTAETLVRGLPGIATRVEGVLAAIGVAEGRLDPATWDLDRLRQPRGLVAPDGSIDGAALAREGEHSRPPMFRAALLAAVLGLSLYLFVGLGGAAALWRTLVRFRVAYAYALPALVSMLVLVFFPFFYGIALSFTNSNIYNTDQPFSEIWVGFDNYKEILGSFDVSSHGEEGRTYDFRNFYWTAGFTVVWTVSNVAIGVSLGLMLALALNTRWLRGKAIYQVLLILPWALPNYITALIWKGMFHQQFGVINQMIQLFGGSPVSWFETPLTSFVTVLATNGWLSFPFMMVISLGALQSIPYDLYEAARVDGATRWQQFRRITLPLLKPALVPAVIISVIWTFNMFNIIYLVSQGEPAGATEILITEAYKLAFEQYRYGYAAAYSTIIFLMLLVYGTWQNRVSRATEAV